LGKVEKGMKRKKGGNEMEIGRGKRWKEGGERRAWEKRRWGRDEW